MTAASNIKRQLCNRCLRPQRTCICQWVVPLEHEVEVLFLQHPLENGNAKNTAGLLHMSLLHSHLAVGEVFAEETLRTLLYAPFPSGRKPGAGDCAVHPILLYPGNDAHLLLRQSAASPISVRHRLVVLDGTWRKSRKMLHLNPLLQGLPRLSLHNPPASHYAIRKAHSPDQLSTYEAVCYALMQLENAPKKYRPLLAAFDGFVAQQQSYAAADATLHSSL